MDEQRIEPYEIDADGNPRIAHALLIKAYKEVEAERDRLAAENAELLVALDECHSLAWNAIEESDRDVWEAHLCEIERVAGAVLAIDEDDEAALRGDGAGDGN